MNYKNRHFHSIIVHVTIAFSVVAAFSHFCETNGISFFMMNSAEWQLLTRLSLFILFLSSLPASVSGVFETNKMYPRWHNTHKIKLFLSVLICIFSIVEIVAIANDCHGFLLKFGLYFVNNLIIFLLSFYGLKITLGRQSIAKTSYVPDFFNEENPVDILNEVKEYVKEKPKRVDFFDFGED